jgi:DNA primase
MTNTSLGNLCTLIKDTINIVDFCEHAYNAVFVPGHNGWFNTLCFMPEHMDTNPSLGVNVETNTFHCFGCGCKGSVIDMVMLVESMDLRQAIEFLLEYLDIQPDIAAPKFYAIKKILKTNTPRINRDILLDAKIKQIRKHKANNIEYYNLTCQILDKYAKLSDSEFQQVIYKL